LICEESEFRGAAAPVDWWRLCLLEQAVWSGEGVRLCEACYQRESRRAVEAGGEVVGQEGRIFPPYFENEQR